MTGRWNGRTLAALATTLLLWASAFAAIRAGLRAFSPTHLALLRFLTASLTLALYAVVARMGLPERRDLPAVALIGFLGVAVYHTALNIGETTVTAGAASLLVNTTPIFTAVLAAIVLRERLRAAAWVGLGISFGGAALIAVGEGHGLRFAPGAAVILVSAAAWSVTIILQKPLLRKYRALDLSAWGIWLGTLPLLVFLPGFGAALRAAPPGALLAGLYLGVFPAAIAYVTWAYVLSKAPAYRAASLLYLVPALAILMAWLWLGEMPSGLALAGGALALAGVAVVNAQRG